MAKRKLLSLLLEKTNGIIKIEDAQKVFSVSREKARNVLWSLAASGWLKRINPGIYIPVPLEATDLSFVTEDPILIASTLYAPCYIGGWTAASFWGFTDQLFLKTWVMTTNPVHHKEVSVQKHTFVLKQVKPNYMYGLKPNWIKNNKILYSDPHKTIIDFANFIGDYGITAFMDIFREYLTSEHKDLETLYQYARKANNRVVFKRIGFLLEILGEESSYIRKFQENISKGYSKLDNSGLCDRVLRRWKLIVPRNMVKND